ncbi:hypothetical protein [Phenylobacterium sp.]|jgi:hypothetical protein|uniref:hypothetical protein n=1 Tax=Phenylobacterium sp. TaxID=1871053 RepID=UPI002F3F6F20
MQTRDSRIHAEAVALWEALYGERSPPQDAQGSALLALVTRNLPSESYVRLRSPFLRPSTIVGPGQPTQEDALD